MEKLSTSEPSPLSPTRWPADAFAWPRSLAVFAAIAVAFYAGVLLDGLVARSLGTTRHDILSSNLTWGIALGQYASYIPVLAVLLVMMPWLARRSLRELGLRPIDAPSVVAGVLGGIAMYVVTIGLAGAQYALTHQKPQEAALSLFGSAHDPKLVAAFTLLAVFVAPYMEEFFFRGFVFNAFYRYMPIWAAAVVSGLVFGLLHGSPTALVPLAGSGIVLAYVYARSGSLTASMIAHALFNLVNVALISFVKNA